MLLPETFSIFYSIGLAVAVSATVFAWRFYIFRRNSLAILYSLPSIIVTGARLSGKTSLIKTITNSEIVTNPFEEGLSLSYLKNENRVLQFVEVLPIVEENIARLLKIKKLNLKSVIYLFDVSKNSDSIENQLENFENTKKFFGGIPLIIVANKIDENDGKLEKLNSRFEKIYEISSLYKSLNKPADSLVLKNEFEDLVHLIRDVSSEIAAQEKEIRSPTQMPFST